MKAILKLTCLLLISSIGFSQSPGGVSGNLHVWWKGDAGVVGNPVTQWTDQSGNGFNLISGNSPSVVSDDINGYSAVSFDGSTDYLQVTDGIFGTNSYNNVYVYAVTKASTTQYTNIFREALQSGDIFSVHLPWGDRAIYDLGTCCSHSRVRANWGTSAGQYHFWTLGAGASGSSSPSGWRKAIYRDGGLIGFNNKTDNATGAESTFYLGAGSDTSLFYAGNFAEVFMYTAVPSTTELQRIHSYLAIKYGIVLGQSSPTAYLNSAGGTIYACGSGGAFDNYDNDIAGIGRDDDSGLEQQSSTSLSGERITLDKGGSFSTDLDFVVWGHNGNGLSYTTTGGYPSYTYRLERIWKADVTGTPGSVSVSFELGNGITNTGNVSDYALIVDNADTNFSSGATAYTSVSLSGNTITFTGVTFSDGDHFTLAYGKPILWDGATWENGSGVGGAPNTSDGAQKMLITGTGGAINADATVALVQVAAAGNLTIASGVNLEVSGEIINDGTIIVESGGSLIQNAASDGNSGSGEYQVQRNSGTLVDDTRFQYWSSSVSNTTMSATFPGSNTTDFYYFDEGATNNWASQPAGSTMTPGRGYITTGTIGLSSTSDNRSFDGDVNNGTIELTTSSVSSGENILVGNPYPSAISSSDFVTTNTGLSGTLWFWNHTTEQVGGGSSGVNTAADYASWNSTGSTSGNGGELPDDYTQSAQGFFVESISSDPTITFNNDMRVSGNNTQFFKKEATSTKNRVWLALSNDSNDYNQLLLGFLPEATDGKDRLYDGKKYKAHPRLSFYSVLDSTDYSIQGLKTLNDEQTKVIPLGVDAWTTGNHTIFVDSLDNWPLDYTLQLVDSQEGIEQNLLDQPVYSFHVDSATSIRNRFYLAVHNQKDTVATSAGVVDYESFVKIYSSQQEIVVESKDAAIQSIHIYNVNGQLIHASTPQTSVKRILSKDWLTGVYIVQCKLNDGTIKHKKIVR